MSVALEQRVDALENYMMQLAYQARRTEMELERLSQEMREFKQEMREFKQEMRAFKDEMLEFKEENRRERAEMNRRWGELANKFGTLVEDIFAPGLPEIARRYFGCAEFEDFFVRRRRKHPKDPSQRREFDLIAVCSEQVLWVEVKSSVRPNHVSDMADFLAAGTFFEFFPEYRGNRLLPLFAALHLTEEITAQLSALKIYALTLGDEHLELRNFDAVQNAPAA
ncbi:MAG: hypothetical protein ACK4JF_09570 [Methylohalobius sp.]